MKQLFTQYLEIKGLSKLSIKAYLYYFDKFGDPSLFNQDTANEFILEYSNCSPVRAFINNLRVFLINNVSKFGLNETVIRQVEIAKRTGAKKARIPNVISEEDVSKIEHGFDNERNKLMLYYNFYCGLRVNELVNIRLFDFKVDWNKVKVRVDNNLPLETATLVITGKRDKQRMVCVPPLILERTFKFLMEYGLEGKPGENARIYLIGGRRWEQLLANASKKTIGKHINPHLLRHSCASWLHNTYGWDLKEIAQYLGHDSVSTTEIYTHISDKAIKEKYDNIFNQVAALD